MIRTLVFAVTVNDGKGWTSEQRKQANECTEPDCATYDDHAVHLLSEEMYRAGTAFRWNWPELFRT